MGKIVKLTESQLKHIVNEVIGDIDEGNGPLDMIRGAVRTGINKLMGSADNVRPRPMGNYNAPMSKGVVNSTSEIAKSRLFSKSASRIAAHLDSRPITPAIKSLFKNAEAEVFVCGKDLSRALTDVQVLKNDKVTEELSSIIFNIKQLDKMLPSKSIFPRPQFKNILGELDWIEEKLVRLMIKVPNNINLKNAHQNLKDIVNVIEDALGQAVILK
jgi:hypothetical protein